MPRSAFWIRGVSAFAHLCLLVALMVMPITAAFDLPNVYTRLPPVMLASVSTPPPEPPRPAPPTPVTAAAAIVPLEAPEGLAPEREPPTPAVSVGVPGGLPSVGSGAPYASVLLGQRADLSAPPPLAPETPRRPGGNIRAPERIRFVAPTYPPVAQAARVSGTVILEAVIDAHGIVQDVKVLRSVALLDRAAIEAVRQWRYSPTQLNGVAIPIVMSVTVTFTLK